MKRVVVLCESPPMEVCLATLFCDSVTNGRGCIRGGNKKYPHSGSCDGAPDGAPEDVKKQIVNIQNKCSAEI